MMFLSIWNRTNPCDIGNKNAPRGSIPKKRSKNTATWSSASLTHGQSYEHRPSCKSSHEVALRIGVGKGYRS